MNGVLDSISLLGMIVFAIVAIQTVKIRRAVVYLGAFSMISSFVYLRFGAPDVAIAEAAIGCTVATVLYLIALKKYKVYTIICLGEQAAASKNADQGDRGELMKRLEVMLTRHELEPQIIFRSVHIADIKKLENYDLMVERVPEGYYFYAHPESYHAHLIESFVEAEQARGLEVEMINLKEENVNEG